MDLWFVAAAAGAGCLAKYWQNTVKKDGGPLKRVVLNSADETSEFAEPFDPLIGQKRSESGSYPFRSVIQKQAAKNFSSDANDRHPEASCNAVLPGEADPGNRADADKLTSSEEYVRSNNSLLSLQPWIFRKEHCQEDGGEMTEMRECLNKFDYNMGQYANVPQSHLSPKNVGPVYGFGRSKSSPRSRRIRKYTVRPLSSTENCLIPRLYKDNIDFEEYVFGPFPSPSPTSARQFLVSDGNRIISRSSFESFNKHIDSGLHQQVGSRVNEVVIGVPSLPDSKKLKRKCEESQHRRLNTNDPQQCPKVSQFPESVESVLFFCLGLSIGMTSNVLSNKREVEKLNDLLKHSENLVQDLQEELEMKNSLVVRELVNEVCEDQENQTNFSDSEGRVRSPPNCDSNFPSPTQQKDKLSTPKFSGANEKEESLSKIEAELEAELERLELNMNASSLEGRISALAELDPELIGNVVHGELRVDVLNGKSRGQSDPDGDTNGSSTDPHMANYAVSPRELSLRLHEIVQSQLEERIKELEAALHHSKKQHHFMEDNNANSQGELSSSDLGASSNQESPILMTQGHEIDHPFCLNLSGEALDAYNEACEEFLRMAVAEEANPPSITIMNGQIDGDESCSSDQSLSYNREVSVASETSTNSKILGRKPPGDHIASSEFSDEAYGSDEMNSDVADDDEEGRMLIQQIVERTRQGSPIVINAQKILSLWTNEQY